MAASDMVEIRGPAQVDLDRCVHCGLCLNACPTYRELGVEMDSPRGRIYQMVKVAEGELPAGASYIQHIGLCLACRACETACPSGVQYGRMVEAARADIESRMRRPLPARLLRALVFRRLLPSRGAMRMAGLLLWLYQSTGLQKLVRAAKILRKFGRLCQVERLAPVAQRPFFFADIGKVYASQGERRYRVAFLAGCIANVCFARLNQASVRVLRKNGCEVSIPAAQTCCGALHLHSGLPEEARRLARRNIDAFLGGSFDAIVTNAAGCGSTLKEYGELLKDDPAYAASARRFSALVKDTNEFLAQIELNRDMGSLPITVTYQDSCHLAHGQRVRIQPRNLLRAVPGLEFREVPLADLCCGSAGIYNIVENEMSMAVLKKKMECINATGADTIATSNPGCMLQLQAGAALYGRGQRVAHVVEILDEAYRKAGGAL